MNVLGLEVLPQFVNFGMNAGEDLRCILVFEEIDDTLDRVRVFVLAQDAFRFLVRVTQGAEIADQDRQAVPLCHDDIAEIIEIADEPDAADHEALVTTGYPAAAGIRIVAVDGVDDVVYSYTQAQ